MRRPQEGLRRYKHSVATWRARYKIASIVGVEEHHLSPDLGQLYGQAAALLVERHLPDEAIAEEFFFPYARYSLQAEVRHEIGDSFERVHRALAAKHAEETIARYVAGVAKAAEAIGRVFKIESAFPRLATDFILGFGSK